MSDGDQQDDWPIIDDVGRAICRVASGTCDCDFGKTGLDCCEALRTRAKEIFELMGVTPEQAGMLAAGAATVRRKPGPRVKQTQKKD